ncbi:MAG: 2-C-methyl-D-erythritol 4-phosphate cytidylyltransferase [Spirochaetota bacterium]
MNIAIICAGGNGERMRTRENKVFLKLDGRPIIYYTLRTLAEHDQVDSIVVTTKKEYIPRLKRIIAAANIDKVLFIEESYHTRQESTYHVLEKLKKMNIPRESYVIIHNAVNPFIKHSELDECLNAAREYGAGLLGFEAADTIKIINESRLIDHTPTRNRVWIAQTPQIIRFDIAVKAFEYAHQKGFIATDDTTLVEAIHEKVKFVECSRENFKITYPQDVELAKRIHARRKREQSNWYG